MAELDILFAMAVMAAMSIFVTGIAVLGYLYDNRIPHVRNLGEELYWMRSVIRLRRQSEATRRALYWEARRSWRVR